MAQRWAGQDLDAWQAPFLAAMGRKTLRTWAPLYLRGLLCPEDRKSLQPWRPAARLCRTCRRRSAPRPTPRQAPMPPLGLAPLPVAAQVTVVGSQGSTAEQSTGIPSGSNIMLIMTSDQSYLGANNTTRYVSGFYEAQ